MNSDRLAVPRRIAFWVGGAGALLSVAAAIQDPSRFYPAYLVALLGWTGIAVGSLGMLLLHHLTGGGWGAPVRRFLEAAARTLPLIALLFVALIPGLSELYPWARPEEVRADEILRHKAPYLNVPFFLIRTALVFAVWIFLAHRARGEGGRRAAGPALLVFCFTASFMAFDWSMSLEPHSVSTIYGLVSLAGQALGGLALAVAMSWIAGTESDRLAAAAKSRDLGNLLLALVMLWAYLAFSQYLIIWSANLPEEIGWYLRRTGEEWRWVALSLVVLHFAAPFLLLLSRKTKDAAGRLAGVAILLLAMRAVDVAWLVLPSFRGSSAGTLLRLVPAFAGVGGLWIAVYLGYLIKSATSSPSISGTTRTSEVPSHG